MKITNAEMKITNVKEGDNIPAGKLIFQFFIGRSPAHLESWIWSFHFVIARATGDKHWLVEARAMHRYIDWHFSFRFPIWYDRHERQLIIMWPTI